MSASASEHEEDEEWAAAMEEHYEFVANLKKKQKKKKSGKVAVPSDKVRLEKCKGSYFIRCEELAANWNNCDSLSIDIDTGPQPDLLQAAVDFGIIEGTMLLAFHEAKLDAYIVTAGKGRYKNNSEDEGSEAEYTLSKGPSKKRKAPAESALPKRGRGRPRKQEITESSSSSSRASKRLFFRLRGRETSENQVFYTPTKGYLDFTDDDFVAFKGVASIPAAGNKVPLEGFKISAEAASSADAWSNFSEDVYEEERVSRWR